MSWIVDPESREVAGPVNQKEWERLEKLAGRPHGRMYQMIEVIRNRKGQAKRIAVKAVPKHDFERPQARHALTMKQLERKRREQESKR